MAEFGSPVDPPRGLSYAPPLVDFSALGNLTGDYFKSAEQKRQYDLARAFQGGIPTDPQGNPDYGAITRILAQKGDIQSLVNLAPWVLEQQPGTVSPALAVGGQPAGAAPAPMTPPTAGPPGARPAIPTPAATAPVYRGGDAGTGTVVDLVSAKLPDDDPRTGTVIGNIARAMKVDPNAPLSPEQQLRVARMVDAYAQRNAGRPSPGMGTPAAPLPASAAAVQPAPQPQGQPQPPTMPQPQAQPARPLIPQARMPLDPQTGKPFTNPQDAIAWLRNQIGQIETRGNRRDQKQIPQLQDMIKDIQNSIAPITVPAGQTVLSPSGEILFQAPQRGGLFGRNDPAVISNIVEGIASGQQPPTLTGLYGMSGPVRSELQSRGFDLAKAQVEWKRAEKDIMALNGPQMTRFVGLATSVDRTIEEVRELANKMDMSGVPLLNKVELQAYIQTQGNTPNGQLAARYIGAINTLKEEFANLAQGGYAPTESVWQLANRQINENYGVKQLGASLDEVQRLIRYRVQAIPNLATLGPGAANRYVGSAGAPQPAPETPAPVAQPAPPTWTTLPNGVRIREIK